MLFFAAQQLILQTITDCQSLLWWEYIKRNVVAVVAPYFLTWVLFAINSLHSYSSRFMSMCDEGSYGIIHSLLVLASSWFLFFPLDHCEMIWSYSCQKSKMIMAQQIFENWHWLQQHNQGFADPYSFHVNILNSSGFFQICVWQLSFQNSCQEVNNCLWPGSVWYELSKKCAVFYSNSLKVHLMFDIN